MVNGLFAAVLLASAAADPVIFEYPPDGAVFPPEITAPSFVWRGPPGPWTLRVEFADGAAPLQFTVPSGPARWTPNAATWEQMKRRSASISIGAARVSIRASRDPAGAPIFYRDVPLMPSEVEKGVIKPLAPEAIPLIAWRLRDLAQPRSRLVLDGLHSCANCHSFSSDGKTLGMDVDGPENDKGTYAIAPVRPRMTIANSDVITWNSFPGKPPGARTIGFLSQLSPDGRFAVTTVNEEVYVANFPDFRFLQVFYPTRGILAWHDRATGAIRALPGADDPHYVHTDAVWTPDGKSIVFARADARDAYATGARPALFANDPNETPIRYDLYRIPFNGGRGGRAEPVAGASANGMSNSFPRVSPDSRWIVYVQSRNGQLLRPDSKLYIVPAAGGRARLMRCNTPLMNSWHSFSPNGRWMVFATKSLTPYTRMMLTHIDEDGNDTPSVLVENAAAEDRAVNLPEFVNIPPDGLLRIDVPAADFYKVFDTARDLESKGRLRDAIAAWRKAIALDPESAKARTNLGIALWKTGDRDAALDELREAVRLKPNYPEARNNLGAVLVQSGRYAEAIGHLRAAVRLRPESAEARHNLDVAIRLARK